MWITHYESKPSSDEDMSLGHGVVVLDNCQPSNPSSLVVPRKGRRSKVYTRTSYMASYVDLLVEHGVALRLDQITPCQGKTNLSINRLSLSFLSTKILAWQATSGVLLTGKSSISTAFVVPACASLHALIGKCYNFFCFIGQCNATRCGHPACNLFGFTFRAHGICAHCRKSLSTRERLRASHVEDCQLGLTADNIQAIKCCVLNCESPSYLESPPPAERDNCGSMPAKLSIIIKYRPLTRHWACTDLSEVAKASQQLIRQRCGSHCKVSAFVRYPSRHLCVGRSIPCCMHNTTDTK